MKEYNYEVMNINAGQYVPRYINKSGSLRSYKMSWNKLK